MFDGKAGKVDSIDREIKALTNWTRTAAGTPYRPPAPAPEPWYRAAAATAGGFLLYLLGCAALLGSLYLLALAARFGWEAGA